MFGVGAYEIFEGILVFVWAGLRFKYSIIRGVILFLFSVLPLTVAFQWIRWIRKDNEETTYRVVFWMGINLFIRFAEYLLIDLLFLINLRQVDEDSGLSSSEKFYWYAVPLITYSTITVLFSFYCYNVTKRYYRMAHAFFDIDSLASESRYSRYTNNI